MCSGLCLVQIILCPSGNHIFLMIQIMLQHFQKTHNLRSIAYQSQHDHTKGILKLSMFIKLVQNHIGICISSQFNTDTHTFSVGMIVDRRNTINFLISYQFCDFLNKPCFIDHIRKFCNDDLCLAIWHSLDICHRPYPYFSSSRSVGFLDSSGSQNCSSCGEIRAFYDGENLLYGCFSVFFYLIVNDLYYCINNLSQIMRWYIGCHTYGNTRGSVCQKVRIPGRQHSRLFLRTIKVRRKIYSILIDIRQHFHGNLAQSCLCITHGGSSVTVYGAEISMSVYQRIPGRPVLSHIYQCAVNRTVSMRMIFTHGITYDTGAFSVRLVRTVI